MRHVRRVPGAPRRHVVLGSASRVGRVDRVDLHDPREGSGFTDGLPGLRASVVCGDKLWPRSLGCINSFSQNIGPHERDDIFICNTGEGDIYVISPFIGHGGVSIYERPCSHAFARDGVYFFYHYDKHDTLAP